MSDPRKPIIYPSGHAELDIRKVAHRHLINVCEAGGRDLGCTGASFMVISIGIWLQELDELDAAATSKMLAALSTIHDPNANPIKKSHAEKKRRAAVKKLFAVLDIEMATPAGSA